MNDHRIIADGLFPNGMDPNKLTEIGRLEVRTAVEALLRIVDRDNARLALALEQLDKGAAEIERLNKQLISDINAETEIDRLETEIERLTADLAGRDADAERFHARWAAADNEIACLRADICEAVNGLSDPCDACDFGGSEAKALRMTIETALHHLRRALEAKDAP